MASDSGQTTPETAVAFERPIAEADQLSEVEVNHIVQRLGGLTVNQDTAMRPHQVESFEDVISSFADGLQFVYYVQPTGSGKTLTFVEVAKEFINSNEPESPRSRALVLEPNIDLTIQTVGGVDDQGKRRGFKGFAPELDARAVHGKTKEKERVAAIVESDVLVTTYNTFRNMVDTLVNLEGIDVEALEKQRLELFRRSIDTDVERDRLKNERHKFVVEAFYKQEVGRAFDNAGQMLWRHKEKPELTDNQVEILEWIRQVGESGIEDESKINLIGKALMKEMNDNIKASIKWTEDSILRARKKRAQRKLAEQEVEDNAFDTDIDDAEYESVTRYKLTEFEAYVASFIHRHRFGSYPAAKKLYKRADIAKVEDYNFKIGNLSANSKAYMSQANGIKYQIALKQAIAEYQLIICDEAHRVIGTETWDKLMQFAKRQNIAVLGCTATDKYYDRSLEEYFDIKANEMSRQEAIKRRITNPLAVFVHNTGMRFENITLDASGDYDVASLRSMRLNEERNKLGIDYIKLLTEGGYQGLVTAIPGDDGAHAKRIAEMLNETDIVDPETGETRKIRAAYILGTTENREAYYQLYEKHLLDWIVFIDALREGWDSDAAKSEFNYRATRSPLLATQRLGRIGRTHEGAPISIVIDLYDGLVGEVYRDEIPPVLAADVYDLDNIPQGYVIGENHDETNPTIEKLKAKLGEGLIEAHHNRYVNFLSTIVEIDQTGRAVSKGSLVSPNEWQTYEKILTSMRGYLPKEILLEAVDAEVSMVRAIKGRSGIHVLPLFNTKDVFNLFNDAPEINPNKLFIDENNTQWITPEGCKIALQKRFPTITPEEISYEIKKIEDAGQAKFETSVARVRIGFNDVAGPQFGLTLLYKFEDIVNRLVPELLQH